jgi:dTDP-4-dehydrorhamnose reductase
MLNVLVTGANGQLGSEIRDVSKNYDYKFTFTDRENLDISNKKELKEFFETDEFDAILNCGAYTAVDQAEDDIENANLINGEAVKFLSEIAKDKNIKLLHVSTDYVFSGKNFKPYREDDEVNPIGVYGKSKLLGEKYLLEIAPKNSIIIRTSWVYSSFGNNFVKTILKYGKERDLLKVVYDQIGTPTYARDLAKVILDILPKIENSEPEIFHYSNEGAISWFDFAKEIVKMAKLDTNIEPIESFEYPTKTERPFYSVLNKRKIKDKYGISIPYWKDSLKNCLIKMGEKR